jgi:hypothetical protein
MVVCIEYSFRDLRMWDFCQVLRCTAGTATTSAKPLGFSPLQRVNQNKRDYQCTPKWHRHTNEPLLARWRHSDSDSRIASVEVHLSATMTGQVCK